MNLVDRIDAYGRQHGLWQPGRALVVACSGGPDSLALLDILSRLAPLYRLALTACYVHHGIRRAADDEVGLVRQEAVRRHCGFAWQYVDVPALARQEKASEEAVGRRERYRILRETARACGAERIAVAHHADDQAETVLLHLLRGSGLDGLAGMAPRRGDIIRPLLAVTKAELGAYAAERQLPVCYDETNDSRQYRRNRIRLDLLPQLQTYNPAITADLNRLADIARADDAFLEQAADALYQEFAFREGAGPSLDKKRLLAQPLAMQRRLIRRLWQEATGSCQDLPFHYVETIRDLAAKGAGKQFQCGRACAYTTRTALCLGPAVPRRRRHR
ncbi:tRNA lysidine(34) synthetase TilS [uncultured Megasphaera sp.]|uniref:tRNA lysidine(34) synthetase TilS n=1 Tax=uncultured Megasphaera sp. TaxID=165188 RepID=UPI0025F6B239|nr:tRNA lysidine(34) synthetase TilS [uncultured Megasphaera sp.]